MRKLLFLFLSVFAILIAAAAAVVFFSQRIKFSDFKAFAEKRIGDSLQADVRVNEVSVGLTDNISLKGLKIQQKVKDDFFYLLDVDNIVFNYHLEEFWSQRLDAPREVKLNSPNFVFKTLSLPSIFSKKDEKLKFDLPGMDRVEFKKGKIHFELPQYKLIFDVFDLEGSLERVKVKGDTWRFAVAGQVDQTFQGAIRINGDWDPDRPDSGIQLILQDFNQARGEKMIRHLNAVVRLLPDALMIDKMEFMLRNLPVSVSGKVLHYDDNPELDLLVTAGKGGVKTQFAVKGSLNEQSIDGQFNFGKKSFPITGQMKKEGDKIRFLPFQIGGYQTKGIIDLKDNMGNFYLEQHKQRINLDFSLQDWHVEIVLRGDHLPVLGVDVVTAAVFELNPYQKLWDAGEWAFEGKLKTDYLILDQTPFPDFKGNFLMVGNDLRNVEFQWHKGFRLQGSLRVEEGLPFEFFIHFQDVQLEDFRSYFYRPLPENFVGKTGGKIRLKGMVGKYDIEGEMNIADGRIRGFDYDEVWLNFYGVPPILQLQNSRLRKHNGSYTLVGVLDLDQFNMFSGVQVLSSEKIVVWSGMEQETKSMRQDGRDNESEDDTVAVGTRLNF